MSLWRFWAVCAAFGVSMACAASASAGVLFQTTPDVTEPTGAEYSDTVSGAGQFMGGSFVLQDKSFITGFTWMGVNTGDMSKLASFTLELWSNTLLNDFYDVPGQRLAQWTVPLADANMVNTGSVIYNLDVYSFSAALDEPYEVEGQETYWLVLYGNSSSGSMFAWLRAESHVDSKAATYPIQHGEGPQWWPLSQEYTFSVLGAPVPEPAALSVLALAAMMACRRQRRRA